MRSFSIFFHYLTGCVFKWRGLSLFPFIQISFRGELKEIEVGHTRETYPAGCAYRKDQPNESINKFNVKTTENPIIQF